MIQNKTILITGGSGFIASHLIERLIENNKIVVYDTGRRNALQFCDFKNHSNLSIIRGDVLDKEQLHHTFVQFKPSIVVHMAAIAGVQTVLENPATTLEVNLVGTQNILNFIREFSVERFIDFSTSEVYGPEANNVNELSPTIQGPITEPRWTYAISKLASELLTISYYKQFNLPCCSIRPFNVYGPRQVGVSAMRNFIVRALKGEDITLYGDGSSVRSLCYVEDFVDGVIKVMEDPKAIGEVFNIGNPDAVVSTKEHISLVLKATDSSSQIINKSLQGPDVKFRVPSIEKIKTILGFSPKINLEEGIKLSVDWYKKHLEQIT